MMEENLFRDCGTFTRIYAKNLKSKTRQVVNFKPSETIKYEYQHTPYILIKGFDCDLILNDHSAKGNFEIAIPQYAFNKMLNRKCKTEWLYENINNFITISITKQSKYTYKLTNICLG